MYSLGEIILKGRGFTASSLFFVFILFLSFPLKAQILHQEKAWHRLIHYKETITGTYKSETDGKNFFLDTNGKYDPMGELISTLEAFAREDEINNQHAICRFPARYLWLKKKTKLREVDFSQCKDYFAFKEKLSAEKVYLIFSSYYINTPASAFGHTFIRLKKKAIDNTIEHSELLDYGVNFSASVTTNNSLIYAYQGLMGGFHGVFASIPFYYKVREYNDFESRDLYSYELNLNQDQVDMLVAHLWELGQTYFDYYYLTENCSYHLLGLLEAANPSLNLTDRLPFYVIPIDTVRSIVKESGLVASIKMRPALRTKLKQGFDELSTNEIRKIKDLSIHSNFSHLDGKSPQEKSRMLDLAIDYYDYKYSGAILKSTIIPDEKRRLLEVRSSLELPSNDKIIVPKHFPHDGHKSRRLAVNAGKIDDEPFQLYQMRFALHDLLDFPLGAPPNSQVEFGKIGLRRLNITGKSKLDHLTIFRVTNLSPISPLDRHFSWRAEMGTKTIYDKTCARCFASNLELGAGYTLSFDRQEKYRVYGMLDSELNNSNKFISKTRLGLGPTLGLYSEFYSKLLMINEIYYRQYFFNALTNLGLSHELRFHFSKSIAINLKYLTQTTYDEYSGGLNWSF